MKLRVTATALNLRSAPDANSSILAKLSKGDTVESAAWDGPWRLVTTQGGARGWVSAVHVTEATTAPAAATVKRPPPVRLACPFCRHPFEAVSASSVTTCPNPNRLPGDTAEQRSAGGRLCRASFAYVAPHRM